MTTIRTLTGIKKVVFCTSDDKYVPKCIVTLLIFKNKNEGYEPFILGKTFSDRTKQVMAKYGIKNIEINLSGYFYKIWHYPIECFYLFYGYYVFYKMGYYFSVYIDGDVYTNKPLDIDLTNIKYYAGVTYGPARNVITNIDEIIKLFHLNHDCKELARIQTGIMLFNHLGLIKIDFFKKIVDIYDLCTKHGLFRKGDDSLMTVYQMVHKTEFTKLDKRYNYCITSKPNTTEDNIDMIFFHFTSKVNKPWTRTKKYISSLAEYFTDKWIEGMITLLDDIDIKIYFPDFYKELIPSNDIHYYWYDSDNFGDMLTSYFLKKTCNISSYRDVGYFVKKNRDRETYSAFPLIKYIEPAQTDKKVIMSIGSILRFCNENAIVYGSGISSRNQLVRNGIFKCVRGPITRRRLLEHGYNCPPIYGDPGLLIKNYYNPGCTNKIYDLGIVPHYTEYQKVKTIYDHNVCVIDVMSGDVETVIDNILSCRKIVSSSLHGIVISNSYGIPVRWIKFSNLIYGDDTKFHDHFEAIGRPNEMPIDARPFRVIPTNILLSYVKPYALKIDLELLQDAMFFDKHGIKKYARYLCSSK